MIIKSALLMPPYAILSALWERQAKGANPTREDPLEKYESDYAETAEGMIDQLLEYARYRDEEPQGA